MVNLICPICGKQFKRKPNYVNSIKNKDNKLTCSINCSSLYYIGDKVFWLQHLQHQRMPGMIYWKREIQYRYACFLGIIFLALFFLIGFISGKFENTFILKVLTILSCWLIFSFLFIPTLNYYMLKSEQIG